MDQIDIKILECLKENARSNASVIGNRVNMSTSAVIERIKKLELNGIVKRYTIMVDPKKVGLDLMVFMMVRLEHHKYNEGFSEFVRRNPQIIECQYIAGDYDFLLKIISKSTQTLEVLLNDIKCIGGVCNTKTSVVLSTVKEEYSVDVELEAGP